MPTEVWIRVNLLILVLLAWCADHAGTTAVDMKLELHAMQAISKHVLY